MDIRKELALVLKGWIEEYLEDTGGAVDTDILSGFLAQKFPGVDLVIGETVYRGWDALPPLVHAEISVPLGRLGIDNG
jgi:hypothetical protein